MPGRHLATRSISFVTVHFSDDLAHNLLLSECVRDPANQLVVVDNRHNLVHDTLGTALEAGIRQARHPLVALVHEDVFLQPGWQPALERSLAALERHDPEWALAGAAGWLADGTMRGHWSDPHGYFDRLGGAPFAEVDRIDEQLILMRRRRRVRLDAALPSIHNIGRDLARQARVDGRKTYVLDAPTVHKFADASGNRIQRKTESPKIAARRSLTYLADRSCSDRYFAGKWTPGSTEADGAPERDQAPERLASPVVLLAKGGGGSRLLSILARDAGMYLGRTNLSGDSLDMVHATYGAVLSRYRYLASGLLPGFVQELRNGAVSLLAGTTRGTWGYKLPESLLVLDEIGRAFPRARFVHLIRDPLGTCLRRTHMTARYDNQVGQASLLAAYRWMGYAPHLAASDPDAVRMAVTTLHQVGAALDWTRTLPPHRLLELRFEDVLADPAAALERLQAWLGADASMPQAPGTAGVPGILSAVDLGRAARPGVVHAPGIARDVASMLAPLRQRLGYATS